LFGDYNPAGRLPVTFYNSTKDLPDFEDYNMKGRTYRYFKGQPLYPFGHGLSYTNFDYVNATISKPSMKTTQQVVLNITLKNTGERDGDEVVQIYIRNLQDKDGPAKSLRGFKRVSVKAGETTNVEIALPASSFEFFDATTNKITVKPGKYEILYGGTSDDKSLKKIDFSIKK
jgi:beta-glucosidase